MCEYISLNNVNIVENKGKLETTKNMNSGELN